MEKQIDKLIEKHRDGYTKYTLDCSISDFKQLQRLMSTKYGIKEYPSPNCMWKHDTINKETYGTVRFQHFELNVTRCATNHNDPVFCEVDTVNKKFWNSKK